jgi:Na+/melibiose symporter-like transporter
MGMHGLKSDPNNSTGNWKGKHGHKLINTKKNKSQIYICFSFSISVFNCNIVIYPFYVTDTYPDHMALLYVLLLVLRVIDLFVICIASSRCLSTLGTRKTTSLEFSKMFMNDHDRRRIPIVLLSFFGLNTSTVPEL